MVKRRKEKKKVKITKVKMMTKSMNTENSCGMIKMPQLSKNHIKCKQKVPEVSKDKFWKDLTKLILK
jgi:hypothetical protein